MSRHFNIQRVWLLLVIAGILLFSFSITSLLSYKISKTSIQDQTINSTLPLTSDNIYSEIQRDLLRPVLISSLMGNDTFLRDWLIGGEKDTVKVREYLSRIMFEYETFTSFLVSDKSKIYYHPTGVLKKVHKDSTRDDWYFQVKEIKDDYEINVDNDMANKDAITIFINHKIFDTDSSYIGVTGVGLSIKAVATLIESYHNKYSRNIYFTNNDGKIVVRNSKSTLETIEEVCGVKQSNLMLNNGAYNTVFKKDGKRRYLNSRYIPELDWYLVVEQGEIHSLIDAKNTLLYNLLLSLVVTIIVLIIIRYVIIKYQMLSTEQSEKIISQNNFLLNTTAELENSREKLEKINNSKDRMFSIIAHDLKNPFSSLIGFSTILIEQYDDLSDDKKREYITIINKNSKNTLDLIENLLTWALSQKDGIKCNKNDIYLSFVVEQAIEPLRASAEKKLVSLESSIDKNILVAIDKSMIKAVIRNLVSNGIKFTPANGVVKVSSTTDNDKVTLSVKDSGVGITEDKIDKLFMLGENNTTVGTENESGTGLGLIVCKEFVDKHGEKIWVESDFGNGSTFNFTMKKTRQ